MARVTAPRRNLADALAPRRRKPYARAGEIVTCEGGHEVASVAADLPRIGDDVTPCPAEPLHDFRPFQNAGHFIHAFRAGQEARCGVCQGRYFKMIRKRKTGEVKGFRLHMKGDGWRGEGRRKRRRKPRRRAA